VTFAFPPKLRLRFYEQEREHLGGHYRCFICQQAVFKTMPKFRDTILLAHASRLIYTDEFVLLCDVNKPKNRNCMKTNFNFFLSLKSLQRSQLIKMLTSCVLKCSLLAYNNQNHLLANVLISSISARFCCWCCCIMFAFICINCCICCC